MADQSWPLPASTDFAARRGRGLAAWTREPWALLLLGIAFAALVLSRKPDVLLHAELWGDDGWSWYPDAYRIGLGSLLLPVGGYLNTLQRLVGLAAQPFPLAWAPTLFAAAALAVQVLPAVFLASSRMAAAWPQAWARLLFAIVLLALPNEIELYVNLTNAQWNLSLLAFLVLTSAPPLTRAASIFDAAALLVSGLSGPFCLLMLPIAAWQALEQRGRTSYRRAALLGAAALVQIGFIVASPHHGRSLAPLGAGPRMLARIVATQVLLGAELGYYAISSLPARAFWQSNVLPVALAALAAVLAVVALLRGTRLLRQFALFAGLVLLSALASPQVSSTAPQWQVMTVPPMGNRYYTVPMLAWIAVLFTLAADRSRVLRAAGAALLAVVLVWGIPRDWREIVMPRTDFVARAHAFAAAPPGTRMTFPIHPPGLTPMVLVKRAR